MPSHRASSRRSFLSPSRPRSALLPGALLLAAACNKETPSSKTLGSETAGRAVAGAGFAPLHEAAFDAGRPPESTPRRFAEVRYEERRNEGDAEILAILLARAARPEPAKAFAKKEAVTFLNSEYVSYELRVEDLPVEGVIARVYRDRKEGRVLKAEIDFPSEEPFLPLPAGNDGSADGSARERNGSMSEAQTYALYATVGRAMRADSRRPYRTHPLRTVWKGGAKIHRIVAEDARGKHVFEFRAGEEGAAPARTFVPHPSADTGVGAAVGAGSGAAGDGGVLPPQPATVFRDEGAIDTSYLDKIPNPPAPEEPVLVSRYLTDLRARTNEIALGRLLDALGGPQLRESKRIDGMPTPAQLAQGFWSELSHPDLFGPFEPRADGRAVANVDASGNPIRLDGRYVSVLVAPRAPVDLFGRGHGFEYAPFLQRAWVSDLANDDAILKTEPYFWGRSLVSLPLSARTPVGRGAPGPSETARLLEQGFDEVQVYHAVNSLLAVARAWGFRDPVLSEKPFRAMVYSTDPWHRDNAFSMGDEIVFGTYSRGESNLARSSGTIWHEMGHSLDSRLAGWANEGDASGLGEGMADAIEFLATAALVDSARAASPYFRFNNAMWFDQSNEFHDGGEAFAGTIAEATRAAARTMGDARAVESMGALLLETMRYFRGVPRLDWARVRDVVLFASSVPETFAHIGTDRAGVLTPFLAAAFAERNLPVAGSGTRARITLEDGGVTLTSDSPYSRYDASPRVVGEKGTLVMRLSLSDGDAARYRFPVAVRASVQGSPLQGGMKWDFDEAEDRWFTIERPGQEIEIALPYTGACEAGQVGTPRRRCFDYVHVRLYDGDRREEKPTGKFRVYLKLRDRGVEGVGGDEWVAAGR